MTGDVDDLESFSQRSFCAASERTNKRAAHMSVLHRLRKTQNCAAHRCNSTDINTIIVCILRKRYQGDELFHSTDRNCARVRGVFGVAHSRRKGGTLHNIRHVFGCLSEEEMQ